MKNMSKYISLTKRNCLVFLKDGASVFFSLLSMLITLVLMGVFLGNMSVETTTSLLQQYGGERDLVLDQANAKLLVQYWTLAGILVTNSVTVTLSVIGIMINDAMQHRLQSFYTSPVAKSVIAFSYMSAAIIIGTLFCSVTFGISLLYIYLNGGTILSAVNILKCMFYILLNVCIFSAMMYVIALFVQSDNAWGGLATVVGSLVGFVGAIYLPVGSLPEKIAAVLKYEPILHGTALMRKTCCEEILAQTFAGTPEELVTSYREHMGIDIVMGGSIIKGRMEIAILLGFGAVVLGVMFLVISTRRIKER